MCRVLAAGRGMGWMFGVGILPKPLPTQPVIRHLVVIFAIGGGGAIPVFTSCREQGLPVAGLGFVRHAAER